jgi:hypothetical protein
MHCCGGAVNPQGPAQQGVRYAAVAAGDSCRSKRSSEQLHAQLGSKT